MKTMQQIKEQYKSRALGGRDTTRLIRFVSEAELSDFDVSLKPEYVGTWEPIEFTRDNVIAQLRDDVAFGFEKALNQRGISSSLMFDVVRMWNWILEDGLEDFDEYARYGLPLFKATAVKYGFDNPIGDNHGNEDIYAAETVREW